MSDDFQINPAHYKARNIEVIEVIEAFELDFCRANAIKYILRAKKKHENPIIDIQKAIWYLERYITQNTKN